MGGEQSIAVPRLKILVNLRSWYSKEGEEKNRAYSELKGSNKSSGASHNSHAEQNGSYLMNPTKPHLRF